MDERVEWESALDALATGAALVDGDGTIRWVNRAGARLMRRSREELIGSVAPFRPENGAPQGTTASREAGERVCVWQAGTRAPRWLAYVRGADDRLGGEATLVSFRDVTEYQQQHRSAAALARTAASMASDSSLEAVLGAMAAEIQRTPGVAGTQIITFGPSGDRLQLMGSAGFEQVAPFFDLLMASRDRGADLITHRSMSERRQQVLPGRRAQMLADPAWEPLHAYVSQLDWEDFVGTPLLSRGKALGALNVYVATGYQATPALLDFITAMAEQAALAVDYATLIHQERVSARREERKRLARDLHDSVVQHVFSIGMQAKALGGIARRLDEPLAGRVEAVAREVTDLVDHVQRDLRGVVLALQPPVSAKLGLLPALNALAEAIERRYDVNVDLTVDALTEEDTGGADFSEDVYQIISEALHNAVKHAAPTVVHVDARLDRERRVMGIDVVDDGRGVPVNATAGGGYGLTSMRDRAGRWGGSVAVTTGEEGSGTRVRAELPFPYGRPEHRKEGMA
uniref:sensor histidine kinase n=1 Tax=Streptomyces sp. NBC_01562 TaxID=2975879 RepID=UPI002F90D663